MTFKYRTISVFFFAIEVSESRDFIFFSILLWTHIVSENKCSGSNELEQKVPKMLRSSSIMLTIIEPIRFDHLRHAFYFKWRSRTFFVKNRGTWIFPIFNYTTRKELFYNSHRKFCDDRGMINNEIFYSEFILVDNLEYKRTNEMIFTVQYFLITWPFSKKARL